MIKRIIFDIDGTLLDTNKDCYNIYKKYFKMNKIENGPQKLYEIIGKYEEEGGSFDKKDLSEYIKKHMIKDFNEKSLDDLLKIYGTFSTLISNKTKKILKYLSEKYELVVLTNWYNKPQEERLEKSHILKYFTKVYGFDNCAKKPTKEAFEIARGSFKNEECLVIGDSINNDIVPALKNNMKAIFLNKTNDIEVLTIANIKELKKIL